MTASKEIMVESAREDDIGPIRSLLAELHEAMTNTEGFDIDRAIDNCLFLMRDPSQHVLVARQQDSVVGFINFSTRKTVMHPAPSALIDELIVSDNYRGKGIGRQLIQAAVDKSRALGCCEVEVSTEKGNTKARRFYRACGLARTGSGRYRRKVTEVQIVQSGLSLARVGKRNARHTLMSRFEIVAGMGSLGTVVERHQGE